MKLTGTNLFVLDRIARGEIEFVERRGRVCVEAVHASHVRRLVVAGCVDAKGAITEEGQRQLAAFRAARRG
jgi:hypothetical protein